MLMSFLVAGTLVRHTLDAEGRYGRPLLFCQIAVFNRNGTFYKGSR